MKKEPEQIDWLQYEEEAREDGSLIVCGVDEAGRGPLAGPVFAAAVVLRRGEKTIDSINILQATYLAMFRAVSGLKVKPDVCLIDGNRKPPQIEIPCRTIVKGDALSMSIACASILAKVSRDRFMLGLDKEYPQYCFAKHKGYGTALHIEMLRKYGASPVHRRSFLKKIEGIPAHNNTIEE